MHTDMHMHTHTCIGLGIMDIKDECAMMQVVPISGVSFYLSVISRIGGLGLYIDKIV